MPIVVWLLTCIFSFFQFFMQVSGNLLINDWMQDFHADVAQASLISSAFFYSYVIMQIPAGMLFDRFGVRRILGIASCVFLVGIVLLYLSQHFMMAFIARFIMGAGASVAFVSMVYVSSIGFSKKRFAMMVGMGEMIAMLGVALLESVAPSLIIKFGWRHVILALAVMAVLQCLLIWSLPKDPLRLPESRHTRQTLFKNLWDAFMQVGRIANVWYAGIICCAAFGVISIFAALWGNDFIQIVYQQDYVHAAFFISLLLVGVAIGGPVIGALNEQHVPHKTLLVSVLIWLFLTTLAVLSGKLSLIGLAVGLFLMGFLGSSYVVAFFVTQESTTLANRGVGIGLCNAVALLGGMVFQPLTGLILEISTAHMQVIAAFQTAMLLLPALMFLAFILAFKIRLFSGKA